MIFRIHIDKRKITLLQLYDSRSDLKSKGSKRTLKNEKATNRCTVSVSCTYLVDVRV